VKNIQQPTFDPTKEELVKVRHVIALVIETDCIRPKGNTVHERMANTTRDAMRYNVELSAAVENSVRFTQHPNATLVKRVTTTVFPELVSQVPIDII